MHRFIMDAPKNCCVDHINHNTLDNRKSNLRIVTHKQNLYNYTKTAKKTSSIYKGVYLHKQSKKWCAQIKVNGNHLSLGLYDSEIKAAVAYNMAARYYFGKYAKLNKMR